MEINNNKINVYVEVERNKEKKKCLNLKDSHNAFVNR